MAGIAGFKPGTQHQNKPELPATHNREYKGVAIDNKYQDLHTLAAYAEGYPMTVDFYGQIVGESNDVREVDPAQSGVLQQYYKVNRLEIRVDKPLDMDFDSDKQLANITGSANVYTDVRPNTFDYFIMRSTRGRPTLVRIVNVVRKSLQRDSMFGIDYQVAGYADDKGDGQNLFESLERKVTQQYYFHKDRLEEGASPILKDEDHQAVVNLRDHWDRILNYYVDTFVNQSFQTIVVPGQDSAVYDKFLVDFLLKIISVQDHIDIDTIKQLGSDRDRYMLQPQFWKALFDRNPVYILQANKFMGLADRKRFVRDNYIAGAGMSTIDKYVYPIEPDLSVLTPSDPDAKFSGPGLQDTPGAGGTVCVRGENKWKDAFGETPLYKRVLCDPYYVLSREFYEKKEGWCVLERLTWDYIEAKMLNLRMLSALVQQYYYLHRLEQYYYGPLLLVLIKEALYAQYT